MTTTLHEATIQALITSGWTAEEAAASWIGSQEQSISLPDGSRLMALEVELCEHAEAPRGSVIDTRLVCYAGVAVDADGDTFKAADGWYFRSEDGEVVCGVGEALGKGAEDSMARDVVVISGVVRTIRLVDRLASASLNKGAEDSMARDVELRSRPHYLGPQTRSEP